MPSTDNWSSTLACRFMADLLGRTIHITDDAAYQHAVQAFVDELQPWMPPVSGPTRSYASLFSSLELDEHTDEVSADFTSGPRLLSGMATPPGTRSRHVHILNDLIS